MVISLPLRNVRGFLVQHRVVAPGQRADKVVRVRRLRGRHDLLFGGALAPVGDVVANGAAEEPGVLPHQPQRAPPLAARKGAGVHPSSRMRPESTS